MSLTAHQRASRRAPRVRTLIAALLGLVLTLPLLTAGLAHLYENQLVRSTEEVLLAESVMAGEAYRRALDPEGARRPLEPPADPEAPRYLPFTPSLDLRSSPVLARAAREEVETATRTPAGSDLGPMLARAVVRNLSGIRILDRRGVVVASPLGPTGYSLAQLPEVQAALRGDYAPVLRRRASDQPEPPLSSLSRTAAIRVSLAIPIFRDPYARPGVGAEVIGAVYDARTPLDPTKALWLVRHELVMPAAVSLMVTLAVAALLSLTLARPLRRLRAAAEAVAGGEPGGDLDAGRLAPQEIQDLSAALAAMRDQLQARADYIREFAANAAHELKTPLTSLRGASELLLEGWSEMSDEQRARFLGNVHADALRMDSLVQRILALARIEASRPARETVELATFLDGVAERYRRRGHQVVVGYAARRRTVDMSPEQLETLVTSLLDNAVRHGAGRPVELSVRDVGAARELEVRDHGPPLPPEHFARVFERFYTTERARGGTGLGLAMVRAIAEAHGGRASAEGHPEGGASFRVVLG